MNTKWFVIQNEKVTGPFRQDEIKAHIASGTLEDDCLIWGRPLSQWTKLGQWHMQSTQKETFSTSIDAHTQQLWHFAVDGDSKGPMSRVELINELKQIRSNTGILVWTKGMNAWADLYEFHDLLDEAGLNRREHQRCEISGTAVLKYGDHAMIAPLQAISEGGFGVSAMNTIIPIGQIVEVEIKSEVFGEGFPAKATLQYISNGSYGGFKFSTLSPEAKSKIVAYIRKKKDADKAAA